MEEKKLQELLDRAAIIDVFNRYAAGVDLRDRELYRSCFTEELSIDFSSAGLGELQKLSAEAWTDQALMLVSMYQSTQHIITNHSIAIDADRATGIAYLQAQHYNPENMMTIGGYYTNKFVRTPQGWKISELKLTSTWTKYA